MKKRWYYRLMVVVMTMVMVVCSSNLTLKAEEGVENYKCFETDISKMPLNYEKYPYIIKGIPNEVYEKSFVKSEYGFRTPAECIELTRFVSYEDRNLYSDGKTYFEALLNIDYRTIDIDTLYNALKCCTYVFREEVETYVDWVKRNHIILKGKGCIIPGTIYTYRSKAYVRSMMEFEIISADVKENLLFNDQCGVYGIAYDTEENNPVIYTRNSYKVSFDLSLTKIWWYDEQYNLLGALSYTFDSPTFIPNVVTWGNTEPAPRIMPDNLWE